MWTIHLRSGLRRRIKPAMQRATLSAVIAVLAAMAMPADTHAQQCVKKPAIVRPEDALFIELADNRDFKVDQAIMESARDVFYIMGDCEELNPQNPASTLRVPYILVCSPSLGMQTLEEKKLQLSEVAKTTGCAKNPGSILKAVLSSQRTIREIRGFRTCQVAGTDSRRRSRLCSPRRAVEVPTSESLPHRRRLAAHPQGPTR